MSTEEAFRPEAGGGSGATGRWRRSAGIALHFVESMIAATFGVEPSELRATTRGRARVARARQVAIYLAHTRLGLTFSEAGAYFDRDRTTAAHACRTIENCREDPGFDTLLDCLERAVDLWPGFAEAGRER